MPQNFELQEKGEEIQAEKFSPIGDLKESIKQSLFMLNNLDKKQNEREALIEASLRGCDQVLKSLERQNPSDIDLITLRSMYIDLKADYEAKSDMNLDDSFDDLNEKMSAEIRRAGVHSEKPSESCIKDTVAHLESLGLNISKVVTKGDPKAPIVIYFMQLHPNPGIPRKVLEEIGVVASQDHIEKDLLALAKDKKLDLGTIYDEGFPKFKTTDEYGGAAEKMLEAKMAAFEVKKKLGNAVHVEGIEDVQLLISAARNISVTIEYRTTAHNIFLAANVAEDIQKQEKKVHALLLGGFHESDHIVENNPVPISEALAYNNLNVVVVDATTPYYKPIKSENSLDSLAAK